MPIATTHTEQSLTNNVWHWSFILFDINIKNIYKTIVKKYIYNVQICKIINWKNVLYEFPKI